MSMRADRVMSIERGERKKRAVHSFLTLALFIHPHLRFFFPSSFSARPYLYSRHLALRDKTAWNRSMKAPIFPQVGGTYSITSNELDKDSRPGKERYYCVYIKAKSEPLRKQMTERMNGRMSKLMSGWKSKMPGIECNELVINCHVHRTEHSIKHSHFFRHSIPPFIFSYSSLVSSSGADKNRQSTKSLLLLFHVNRCWIVNIAKKLSILLNYMRTAS